MVVHPHFECMQNSQGKEFGVKMLPKVLRMSDMPVVLDRSSDEVFFSFKNVMFLPNHNGMNMLDTNQQAR